MIIFLFSVTPEEERSQTLYCLIEIVYRGDFFNYYALFFLFEASIINTIEKHLTKI